MEQKQFAMHWAICRFGAQQREIERIRNEKKERENNADNQGRQSASRPSSEHPSGA